RSAGSVSKRYLSRYQRERRPDRRVKSPSSRATSSRRPRARRRSSRQDAFGDLEQPVALGHRRPRREVDLRPVVPRDDDPPRLATAPPEDEPGGNGRRAEEQQPHAAPSATRRS